MAKVMPTARLGGGRLWSVSKSLGFLTVLPIRTANYLPEAA